MKIDNIDELLKKRLHLYCFYTGNTFEQVAKEIKVKRAQFYEYQRGSNVKPEMVKKLESLFYDHEYKLMPLYSCFLHPYQIPALTEKQIKESGCEAKDTEKISRGRVNRGRK